MQIVGGRTPSWSGNETSKYVNTVDDHQGETEWTDLEADLCYWTKALRPVQVIFSYQLKFVHLEKVYYCGKMLTWDAANCAVVSWAYCQNREGT